MDAVVTSHPPHQARMALSFRLHPDREGTATPIGMTSPFPSALHDIPARCGGLARYRYQPLAYRQVSATGRRGLPRLGLPHQANGSPAANSADIRDPAAPAIHP